MYLKDLAKYLLMFIKMYVTCLRKSCMTDDDIPLETSQISFMFSPASSFFMSISSSDSGFLKNYHKCLLKNSLALLNHIYLKLYY